MFMHLRSCDRVVIANLVLVDIYTFEVVITVFFTYLYMCCFFSFLIHIFLIYCIQSIISVSH